VQPSSLIFLVIIAIWAAYLLQHWIRRREHLVTARSIDRFSEAMRVLERRTALTEATMSAPSPRSYAVSPARPSRPEVVVMRAQPSVAATSTRVAVAPVQSSRGFRALGGLSARRLRGLSLLASLALLVVVTPLALLGAVPGVSVLLTVAVLVLDLAWLRRAAQVERASRRTTTRPARRMRAQAAPTARPAAATTAAARETRTASAAPAAAGAQDTEDAEADERPYDVQGAQAEAPPVKAEVDTVSGTGWQPVPVPPPTYTLKAKAPAPVPTPEPVVVEEPEAEMHELVQRRRAAGA
jgi:hypothetical protein